ncbi:hypothetical protein TWF718_002474 [Orbilia javanica]|uniref:Uncharacterized protein n=1 Tax=Orbilia javanica TaxID=47235 RepID=A0AAN8R9X9_9PEZI
MTTLPAPYKYVIVEKDTEATQNPQNVPPFVAFDSLEDPIPTKARKTLLERMSISDLRSAKMVIAAINEEQKPFLLETGYRYFQYYLVNILVADYAPKYSLSLRLGRPADARRAVAEMDGLPPAEAQWDDISEDSHKGEE